MPHFRWCWIIAPSVLLAPAGCIHFHFLHSQVVQELLHSNFGFHLSIKYFLHNFCSILYSSIAPVLAIAIKHGLCSWQSLPIWMQQDPWFNVSSIQHWERQRGLQSKLQSKAFLDTNSFWKFKASKYSNSEAFALGTRSCREHSNLKSQEMCFKMFQGLNHLQQSETCSDVDTGSVWQTWAKIAVYEEAHSVSSTNCWCYRTCLRWMVNGSESPNLHCSEIEKKWGLCFDYCCLEMPWTNPVKNG